MSWHRSCKCTKCRLCSVYSPWQNTRSLLWSAFAQTVQIEWTTWNTLSSSSRARLQYVLVSISCFSVQVLHHASKVFSLFCLLLKAICCNNTCSCSNIVGQSSLVTCETFNRDSATLMARAESSRFIQLLPSSQSPRTHNADEVPQALLQKGLHKVLLVQTIESLWQWGIRAGP